MNCQQKARTGFAGNLKQVCSEKHSILLGPSLSLEREVSFYITLGVWPRTVMEEVETKGVLVYSHDSGRKEPWQRAIGEAGKGVWVHTSIPRGGGEEDSL